MIIKRHPEDFRVEELLTPDGAARISSEVGPHVLCKLTKRNLGTDEAVERIALHFGLPPGTLHYVGLKDKHALTVQYVSIALPRGRATGRRRTGRAPRLGFEMPAVVEKNGWRLERIGWLDGPLAPAEVAGNRFWVTLRNLTRRRSAALDEAAKLLTVSRRAPRALRFVNYFGEQRFGSARHRRGFAARHLIKSEFGEALRLLVAVPERKDSRERRSVRRMLGSSWGDWTRLLEILPPGQERRAVERLAAEGDRSPAAFAALPDFIRRIAVEAYQSWLWNEIARRVVERISAGPIEISSSRFGELAIPRAEGIPEGLTHLAIPLPSPAMRLEEPWGPAAEEVLAGEGISPRELRVPGLRRPYFSRGERDLFVEAARFSLGPFELDESAPRARRLMRRLKFDLPRGAYATVLIAALEALAQKTSE